MFNTHSDIDFIGIGAMKSATTWIYDCLVEHPRICAPMEPDAEGKLRQIKEVHFFDGKYDRGVAYYESLFEHASAGQLKGEFTPRYLYYEKVPGLIHDHYPRVKLIVCLRNPIERAYSQYYDYIDMGGRDFTEALRLYPELTERGYYFKQLGRFMKVFTSEQMLVLLFDDIKHDRLGFLQGIFRFLEVEDNFVPSMLEGRSNVGTRVDYRYQALENFRRKARAVVRRVSPGGRLRGALCRLGASGVENAIQNVNTMRTDQPVFKPKMAAATRERLRDVYREDISHLEQLIGRDLSSWR